MIELSIDNKQKYFNENYPFANPPKLSEKRECLHCGNVITIGDFKVFKDELLDAEFICCPNAPDCDGTVMDWMPLNYNRN